MEDVLAGELTAVGGGSTLSGARLHQPGLYAFPTIFERQIVFGLTC
jgi:hypothetical protein